MKYRDSKLYIYYIYTTHIFSNYVQLESLKCTVLLPRDYFFLSVLVIVSDGT